MSNDRMKSQISEKGGFIAALDQSGGSTPGALKAYGIPETAYSSEEDMFRLIHEMRVRIDQSELHEEFKRPIDRWRSGVALNGLQALQKVIRAQRSIGLKHQTENLTSQGGQPDMSLGA